MAGRGRKPIIQLDGEDGWPKIQRSLDQLVDICENDFPPEVDMSQAMGNYSCVYNMAVQRPPNNYCEELYQRYKQFFEDYLNGTVLPALREQGGTLMIGEIGRRWKNHKDVMVKWMKKFFLYLDTYYTKRENLPNIQETGMRAFKETMFPLIRADVTTAILDLVSQERADRSVDRDLLRSVVDLFVQMGLGEMDVYRDGFEVGFLSDSSSYYSRMASENAPTMALPVYLQLCDRQISIEQDRVGNYLHPETEEKLIKVVKKEMLEIHQSSLMRKADSGLLVMFGLSIDKFSTVDKDACSLLYKLYKNLPTGLIQPVDSVAHGKAKIAEMLFEHIKTLGLDQVNEFSQSEDPDGKTFIQRLVDIHKHFVMIFDDCCEGDKMFHQQLKDAFEKFIINNDELGDPHFVPMHLAAFCDEFLDKSRSRSYTQELASQSLESAVTMYSYLRDKDYFNQHYKRSLANRLLHNASVGLDQEDQFLTLIKQRCGANYTRHQEAMIADIRSSEAKHGTRFATFRTENSVCEHFGGVKVQVALLNERMWPAFKSDSLRPLGTLGFIKQGFDAYFQSTQKGDGPAVDLNWLFTQGDAVVKPLFGGNKGFGNKAFKKFKIELTSPYQLAILMLFNERDEFTALELEAELGLSAADLLPVVESLYRPKIPVLRMRNIDKDEARKEEWGNMRFEVNKKMPQMSVRNKKPLPKVRFDAGKVKNQMADIKKIDMAVQEERKFAIQAVAVRAMKAERKLKATDLGTKVCKDLAFLFTAHPPFVKKIIEELLEKDFFKRDEDDPRTLVYIA